jgi:hypothetical protein
MVICIGTLASGVPAHAAGRLCSDIFRDSQKVDASRIYRGQLMERAQAIILELRSNEEKHIAVARAFFKRRSGVSEATIRATIQNSKTLGSVSRMTSPEAPGGATAVKPPDMMPHTLSAMEDASLSAAYLEGILSNDPYFVWLKHNALTYKIPPARQRSFARELLEIDHYQPEPAKLFMMYRHEGLPIELALLRVQRNLDPDVSFEARTAIDRALVFAARLNAVEEVLVPMFSSAGKNPGTIEAWYEMTSLASGRAAMAEMQTRLKSLYGLLFPETSFDRLLILFRRYDPSTFFIEKFRIQRVLGKSDESNVEEFRNEIRILRTKLNVPNSIPDIRFAEFCMRSYELRFNASYAFVLADVFESPVGTVAQTGMATNLVSSQMLVLHKLIEFGEALDSRKNMRMFVEEIGRENELKFSQ